MWDIQLVIDLVHAVIELFHVELTEDLEIEGFKNIVSIDASSVAIEWMKKQYEAKPSLECGLIYRYHLCISFGFFTVHVMNALDMKEFAKSSFDVIMDKGTLDTILVGVEDLIHRSIVVTVVVSAVILRVLTR